MSATAKLENFRASEVEGLTDKLKVMLQALRYEAGVPIYIKSGVRPDDSGSEHSFGAGIDITDDLASDSITSSWRFAVLRAAFLVGFTRIGVYDNHIHLGVSTSHAQRVCWWGTSS